MTQAHLPHFHPEALRTCWDGWPCTPTNYHVEIFHPVTRAVLQVYVSCKHCTRDLARINLETDEEWEKRMEGPVCVPGLAFIYHDGSRKEWD